MPHETLDAALQAAIVMAWEASDIILAHYRAGVVADIKNNDPTNLVTQADRDANMLLMARLQSRFPQHAVMAEECTESHSYARRQHTSHLWCIDPIDGTREFVAQSGQFAVMMGLAIDGFARLGVVLQPTEGRLYAGILGDDGRNIAFTADRSGNQQPLQVLGTPTTQEARMMISRTYKSRGIQSLATSMGVKELLPMGSVGLKMAALASGRAEIYVSLSSQTHEWDACGPEAILRGAGGAVTDLDGAPLRYNKPTTPTPRGIVASNGVLHGACLAAVAELEASRVKSR